MQVRLFTGDILQVAYLGGPHALVATSGADGSVRLFASDSGGPPPPAVPPRPPARPLREVASVARAHDARVGALVAVDLGDDDDGQALCSGDARGEAKLWSVAENLAPLEVVPGKDNRLPMGHPKGPLSLCAVEGIAGHVVSGGVDGRVAVWRLERSNQEPRSNRRWALMHVATVADAGSSSGRSSAEAVRAVAAVSTGPCTCLVAWGNAGGHVRVARVDLGQGPPADCNR